MPNDCSECSRLDRELTEAEEARNRARKAIDIAMTVDDHRRAADAYRRAADRTATLAAALGEHQKTH